MKEDLRMLMPLNLQFFAESNDEGDFGDEGNDGEGNDGEGQRGQGGGKGARTFSQDEVTRLLTREKEQGRNAILNELGVDDAEVLKQLLEEKRQKEEDEKTELQKKEAALLLAQQEKQRSDLEKQQLEAKLSAIALGVNPKRVDDVVTLAMVKVTDQKDLSEVLSEMKTAYSNTDFFVDSEEEGEEQKGTRGKLNKDQGNGKEGKKTTIAERLLGNKKETKKSSYFSN